MCPKIYKALTLFSIATLIVFPLRAERFFYGYIYHGEDNLFEITSGQPVISKGLLYWIDGGSGSATVCGAAYEGGYSESDGGIYYYNRANVKTIPSSVKIYRSEKWHDDDVGEYYCNGRWDTYTVTSISLAHYETLRDCFDMVDLTFPDEITYIGAGAFSGTLLKNVTIDGGIKNVEHYTFANCPNLENVIIGNGITNIGDYAFGRCEKLKKVVIGNSVKCLGSQTIPGGPVQGLFNGCIALEEINIPDSIKMIGEMAFGSCAQLKGVQLGGGVEYIGSGAFGYSGLTNITIVASVKSVGMAAFGWCTNLTSVVMEGDCPVIDESAFLGVNEACVAYLPLGNETYQVESGKWCGLPVIYYGGSFSSPGHNQLYCFVTFDTNSGRDDSESRVCLMGDAIGSMPTPIHAAYDGYVFDGWHSEINGGDEITASTIVTNGTTYYAHWRALVPKQYSLELEHGTLVKVRYNGATEVVVPAGVTRIGKDSFEFGPLLNVTLPDGIMDIGEYAFCWCDGLTSISIPSTVTNIASGAFQSCLKIERLVLPENLMQIGSLSFYNCTGLTSVVVGSGVTKIDNGAFKKCVALSKIVFMGDAPALGSEVFDGVATDCVVYVKKTSSGWMVSEGGKWNGMTLLYLSDAIIQEIPVDAAPEAVTNAIEAAGFADADVKGVIGGSAAEYNAFKTWAASVKRTAGSASPATAAGEEAVVANTNAAAAYLLGAERLFENAPTVEIEEVSLGDSDEMGGGVGANGSTMTLAVTVKDGEVPVSCVATKVAALFEATGDLGDWTGAAKLTPTVKVETGEGATMRFTVTPGDGTQPRAFLRIHKANP